MRRAHSRKPASTIETNHDRMELARDAGTGPVSLLSVFAGTVVGFGTFIVLAAVVGAIAVALGYEGDVTTSQWAELAPGAVALTLGVLALSWAFGGYVAGRMARRAGAVNGILSFLLGVSLALALGGVFGQATDPDAVDTGRLEQNLRAAGIPTDINEMTNSNLLFALGVLALVTAAAALGGQIGERWHGDFLARAFNPMVGAGTPDLDLAEAERARVLEESQDIRLVDRGNNRSGGIRTRTGRVQI